MIDSAQYTIGRTVHSSLIMISAPRICRKCGAEIFADAPEGLCTACLFETGLHLFAQDICSLRDCGMSRMTSDRDSAPDKTNRYG